MTGTARSQYAIDLDEIERQIREASTASARGGAQGDPLTELARIVETSPQPSRAPRFAAPSPHAEPPARIAPEPTLPPMPRRSQDELEAAMRSLDEFFKNDRPPAEPVAAAASGQPADDLYGDWDLRGGATAPGAPQEPRYDFEESVAASGLAPHEGSARAAIPGAIDDGYWDEPPQQAAHHSAPPPVAKPSRRPMILAASVLGVAVIGVAGALSLRGAGGKAPTGTPPIIKAESGPSKVAPANPGGLEIPDQDIQILQRSPSRGKSVANVVNNEEEPVDLREAVRREAAASAQTPPPRPVEMVTVPPPAPVQRVEPVPVTAAPPVAAPAAAPLPAAPQPVATPTAPPASVEAVTPPPVAPAPASSVPEPRRVKTVAIKPPDPPAPPAPPPPAPVAVAPVAALAPVVPAPAPVAEPPPPVVAAAPEPPPAAPKPKVQGSIRETTGTVRPAASTPAPAVNPPPLQITPAPSQVASLGRDPMRASTPPAPPPPEPPAETRPATASTGGGFVVQLTSEGSEDSARAAIGRAQGRFSELSGYSSSIQRREVRGQMRYRVRFGSMSRADANGLCATLKRKGQDCIIQAQ